MMRAIRKKAPEEDIQVPIDSIHQVAEQQGISDVLVPSTDAYVTSICYVGSKSLSHVLSCIERCKDRLSSMSSASSSARNQIITSVMSYWKDQPGIGVNTIDKLLNYTILTPVSVVEWVLLNHPNKHQEPILNQSHLYELVALTVTKVNNRVRQIVTSIRSQADDLPADQKKMLEDTLRTERVEQKRLYDVIEEGIMSVAAAAGGDGEQQDAGDENERMTRDWAERWLRVFRRWAVVEEAFVGGGGDVTDDDGGVQEEEEAAGLGNDEQDTANGGGGHETT